MRRSLANSSKNIFLGVLIGFSSYWNGAAFIAMGLSLLALLSVKNIRKEALTCGIFALFTAMVVRKILSGDSQNPLTWDPNFLVQSSSVIEILFFVIVAFGPVVLLLPVLAVFSRKDMIFRYLFLTGIATLIFAFSVQVSPDKIVNHKFVLLGLIPINLLCVGLLLKMWSLPRLKLVAVFLFTALVFTGVIEKKVFWNIYQIKHSVKLELSALQWVDQNTSPADVFLVPEAGPFHWTYFSKRKIYFGYYGWVDSMAIDIDSKKNVTLTIVNSSNLVDAMLLANENSIDYLVFTSKFWQKIISQKNNLWQTIEPEYINTSDGIRIFSLKLNHKN